MNITSTNIAARDYLCLNRLHYIVAFIKGKFPDMLQEDDELIRLLAVSRRLASLPTGRRKELPFPVSADTWGVVSALPGGRCCHLINGCYYNQARYLRHLAGNVCYDAFCEAHGWESYNGHPLPGWDRVTPEIKAGWIKAAAAVQEISKGEITNLKDQIDELQAEVEGLAKTGVCQKCKWASLRSDPFDPDAQFLMCSCEGLLYHREISKDFGCLNFASKEGN